jgi:hypothetical protein
MDWIQKFQWGSPWRDMRVGELVARGFVAEAVHLKDITVSCEADRDPSAYIVQLDCILDVERPEDRRPIAIDFTDWPLEYLSISCAVAESVDRLPVDGERPVVVLSLRPASNWQGARVLFTMRWFALSSESEASALRFLILPDFLPPILGSDQLDNAPQGVPTVRQPRLTIAEQLPPSIMVAALRGKSMFSLETERPVQLALFDREETECLEEGRVVFVGREPLNWASKAREDVAKAQLRYLEYLGQELGVLYEGPLVLAFGLKSIGPTFAFGPTLRAKPAWYGIGDDLRAGGNPGSHVRLLSGIWWGAGCRVYGKVGAYLCMGIGGALGLRWLALHDTTAQLGATAKVLMDRAGCDKMGADPKVDDLSVVWGALALSLFHHLKRDPTRGALQAMTREYWGSVMSDAALVQRLVGWGIQVPRLMIDKVG